jgi:hypothetical protein
LLFAGKWMELENIILSQVSHVQKAKIACSLISVDYRPKINSVMLFDRVTCMAKGRPQRERWERKGNLKLERG